MRKYILESFVGSGGERMSAYRVVAETALLLAMLLAASWLVRG
jgi:hypothetical protein